jgi:signal peptidase
VAAPELVAAPDALAAPDAAAAQPTRHLKPATARPAVAQWIGVVLLSLAVLAVSVLILVPRVTGSQTFSVLTNSMAPKLGPGTFLVMAPASFADLRTGDVVTYQLASGRPEVVTHRIVGFSATQQGERTLITKGDNNSVVDPTPVREAQVRGRLFYAVPYVGYLANALGNSDRTLWMTVGAIGLIGYGLGNVIKAVRRGLAERRRKEHPATGEQS